MVGYIGFKTQKLDLLFPKNSILNTSKSIILFKSAPSFHNVSKKEVL